MNQRAALTAAIFWGVHLVGLPLIAVGYVLFVVKWLRYTRQFGASGTALATLLPRWLLHRLGERRDVPAARLMRVLPNLSQPGVRLMAEPTLLAHRLTGYLPRALCYPYHGVPSINEEPIARTTYFDAALARHLGEIGQMVILGAGFDTRSYRLPAGSAIRCFEVDMPRTQALKRATLARSGVDASGVTFVAADFEHEEWIEKLIQAGFDPHMPTFFLWEGVTMYLDRRAVEETLRRIAATAAGSVVAFDYFSTEHLESRSFSMRYARVLLSAVGEPLGTFGLDTSPPARQRVATFVESCGLMLEEHRSFGAETFQRPPEAGFVVAVVPSEV